MKIQHILTMCLLFLTGTVSAQKYYTKTGKTEFQASVETFEPVEAENNSTTAVLNASTGEVAALLFVKAFHFKVALMEEHFNENYMDSDQHPKAKFSGKIEGFDLNKLDKNGQEFMIEGTLTLKGKSKKVKTKAQVKYLHGHVMVNAAFSVKPEDFDIEIPSIVRSKIAPETKIILNYDLIEKK